MSAEVEIPYAVKPHPVTGLFNGKFGIWLFLASEVMLFGALFSTYVLLRVGTETWPHGYSLLNVPAPIYTAVDRFHGAFRGYFELEAVYRQVILRKTAEIPR